MIINCFKITSAVIVTLMVLLCGSLLLLHSQNAQANFPPCNKANRGNSFPPKTYLYPAVVKSTVALLTQPRAPRCDLFILSAGTLVYVLLESSRVSGWVVVGQHTNGTRGYVPRDSLTRIPENSIGQFINKRQTENANLKNQPSRQKLMSHQRILQRLGYAPGPIDGILGQRTIRAIKQFQRDNNLNDDGIVGRFTQAALNTADNSSRRSSSATPSSLKDYQLKLKQLGFDPGPIDGLPGPRTTAAIVQFQLSRKLVADGILGPITRRALDTAT